MSGGNVKPFNVLLLEALHRRKMTAEQLGHEIGRSTSQVYRYLEGKSLPRPAVVKRIATVLKMPASTLAQSLLVEAASAEQIALSTMSVETLQRRIALLEHELDQRRTKNGKPPLDVGHHVVIN